MVKCLLCKQIIAVRFCSIPVVTICYFSPVISLFFVNPWNLNLNLNLNIFRNLKNPWDLNINIVRASLTFLPYYLKAILFTLGSLVYAVMEGWVVYAELLSQPFITAFTVHHCVYRSSLRKLPKSLREKGHILRNLVPRLLFFL
jgi:hypothetical protein